MDREGIQELCERHSLGFREWVKEENRISGAALTYGGETLHHNLHIFTRGVDDPQILIRGVHFDAIWDAIPSLNEQEGQFFEMDGWNGMALWSRGEPAASIMNGWCKNLMSLDLTVRRISLGPNVFPKNQYRYVLCPVSEAEHPVQTVVPFVWMGLEEYETWANQ